MEDYSPEIQMIDKNKLEMDASYHRPAKKEFVNTIVRNFWDLLFEPLTVSERDDGSLIVVDGWQRLEAAKQIDSIVDVPCLVMRDADIAREMDVYVGMNCVRKRNANRKNLNLVERRNASWTWFDPQNSTTQSETVPSFEPEIW